MENGIYLYRGLPLSSANANRNTIEIDMINSLCKDLAVVNAIDEAQKANVFQIDFKVPVATNAILFCKITKNEEKKTSNSPLAFTILTFNKC